MHTNAQMILVLLLAVLPCQYCQVGPIIKVLHWHRYTSGYILQILACPGPQAPPFMLLDNFEVSAFQPVSLDLFNRKGGKNLYSSLLPYAKNKNTEEIKGWCQKRRINKEEMTNVTYKVKTQANMKICQDGNCIKVGKRCYVAEAGDKKLRP